MTASQSTLMFRIAALFNWSAVLILSLLAGWLGIVPAPQSTMVGQIALLAIFLFGCGYWMVAGNLRAHRGIVLLGAWAKLGVVAIVAGNWLLGSATLQMLALVSGDVLFAALFFLHLKSSKA